ncbi:MAG: U32 family peptidase [Magnetococcales bacterium]|nr:U32 family peptidase [Magnetococcales bacterium]
MDKVEVLSPAGNLPSLKAAVDNGADAVYFGFRNETNARNFEGLNFSEKEARQGIEYAHKKGSMANITLNTNPRADDPSAWYRTVDVAAEFGADALILSNLSLLKYARERYPKLPLHLSVQASVSNYEAINFYQRHFGITRVILPRVLTVEDIRLLSEKTSVELEVFAFGGLCVMTEGRCFLSSYVTGVSPNIQGVCSPAKSVRFEHQGGQLQTRLGGVLIAQYEKGEQAAYPTICKGCFEANDQVYHVMEEPSSLNILEMLPEVLDAGVTCLKIEGRQRTKSYVGTVTKVIRQAVDAYYKNPDQFRVKGAWQKVLNAASEGSSHTLGTYEESWQ